MTFNNSYTEERQALPIFKTGDTMKNFIILKEFNQGEFKDRFLTDDDCYKYLMELKWSQGFRCTKCDFNKSVKGKKWYNKRCSNCMYDESATSNTLFHKLKFPIIKAFNIYFLLIKNSGSVSTVELAKEYGLQQRTCWLFKQKVLGSLKKEAA